MNNAIYRFPETEIYPAAEDYFIKYSGLDVKKPKHRRILEAGLEARESGVSGIDVRAVVSDWEAPLLTGGTLTLDGVELSCHGFSYVPDGAAARVFAYAITCGECSYGDGDPIMQQLCADIWGTAYVDVGRELLEKELQALLPEGLRLSDSFGPGFYGMPVSATRSFTRLLDVTAVGIEVRESGIMLPLKSCAGLYLAVPEGTELPPVSCSDCAGNSGGCEFCTVRRRRLSENA